jgi:hypothetical protein
VKHRELLKRLRDAAEQKGLTLDLVRHGGKHDIYRVGDYRFPIGRHADIPEMTALKTIKEVENL